jgi:peptidoglycan/LPS O-acetylase OafA/YrhL
MLLPRRIAPFVYGIIQAALTTAVATAIATYPLADTMMHFVERWMLAWIVSWVSMLPVVVLVAPLIQRAVVSMTESADAPTRSR